MSETESINKVRIRYEADGDDERELRTQGTGAWLNVKEQKVENPDPFTKSAEVLKTYSGTKQGLKRRITNELKKANQSVDGEARSNQIEEEAWTGYDAFEVVSPPYNLDYLAELYERSVPHKASVEAKVDNIVGLGFNFIETNKTKRLLESQQGTKKSDKSRKTLEAHKDALEILFDEFHEEDTFTETLQKMWRDYETIGNGYLEIARKKDGSVGYIGHIPAQTIRIRRKHDGYVQLSGNKVQFFAPFGAGRDRDTGEPLNVNNPIGEGTPNEIIHLKNHVPSSTYYGIPDVVPALMAITSNEFIGRFNLDYFEHKAIPRHLILLKGGDLDSSTRLKLLEFFETNLKGQNHRSLFIPLPGDTEHEKVEFSIEPVEAGVQEASFLNLRKTNDADVYTAHRTPETKVKVGMGINIAVAQDADKTFKEQVCGPRQRVLEKKINRIVKELTDAFEFALNEVTLTDEDTQSKIDERRIKTGQETPNEQRLSRGKPAHPDGDSLVDLSAKDKIAQQQAELTTTRERDSARSANATDSNKTSRNAKGTGRAQS